MNVEITCRECGSNHFRLVEAVTDACAISCQECGHLMGSLGDLKEQVARIVLERSRPVAVAVFTLDH